MSADPRVIRLLMELRKRGISERVLSAIERMPRDAFVDEPFAHAAWDNSALPIACGQTISQPFVVAYATEKLEPAADMRVLEIGTGSGYQAAVLAGLCRRVYTVERHKPLLREAETRFKTLKLDNIVTRHGDGLLGWPEQAPFDRILLSAAIPEVPVNLIEQLKPGGRLVAPIGAVPNPDGSPPKLSLFQHLTLIIRGEGGIERTELIPVMFVPMVAGLPDARKPEDGERKG